MSRSGEPPRRPLAQHGEVRAPSPIRQLGRVLGVAASIVLVSVLGVGAYVSYEVSSVLAQNVDVLEGTDVSPPSISALDDTGVTILFAGLDACEEEYKNVFDGRCVVGQTYTEADILSARNDVNMVVHISPEPRRVTVLSFPRDLMLPVPSCDTEDGTLPPVGRLMLNEVFPRGGISCVAKTLSEVSGLDIGYAASITWGGVIEITQAIGGVEVCVGETGVRDMRHTGLNLDPGMHELSGQDALEFLRTRHGVGDGSDLARIGNQQVFMSALVKKLLSEEVLTKPGTVVSLARTTLENVRPSSTLVDPFTLARMAMAGASVPAHEYTFVRYPVVTDPSNPNRVVIDPANGDRLNDAVRANTPIDLGLGGGISVAEEDTGEEPGDDSTGQAPSPAPDENDPEGPSAAPDDDGIQTIDAFGLKGDSEACSVMSE